MSPIFDALCRSETEHAGDEQTATATATELLKRAERRITAQLSSEAATGHLSDPDLTATNLRSSLKGISTGAQSGSRLADAEITSAAERASPLSETRTLECAPDPSSRLVCMSDKGSPAAEAFRLLGVRLRHIREERRIRKVLITSTVPQEGKSFSAGNLACILASGTKQKTLLLEGDLRRPTLSQMFGAVGKPGLCEYILDGGNLSDHIYSVKGLNLWLLPAGSKQCNPLDVIQSNTLPDLMKQLSTLFDWIIIDSPPILPLADTSAWAQMADGVLLVARQGVTGKKRLQRGLDAVDPHSLIGVLLNSSSGSPEKDYYYYYRRESGEPNAAALSAD